MIFTIITLSLTLGTSYFIYKTDTHNIIYNAVERKYKKWKKINSLVASRHENLSDIYYISIKMILQAIYLSFVQYLNNSVRKLDKNTYEVSYIIGAKSYKMIAIPKKGPCPIIQIRDENDDDLTDYILPYYGPNYDWHSIKFIPQFFKCKKLIFEMDDGNQKVFNQLDYIEI